MRSLKNRATAGFTAAALVVGSLFGTGALALADTTIPDAPADLIIAPEVKTVGPVVLTWTAPSNETIDRYQIFRFVGSGTPSVGGITYLADVNGTENSFVEAVPTEGTFQYAVVAVDDDDQASQPSNWVSILVDTDDNGVIEPDNTAPAAPTDLNLGGGYTNDRVITLNWAEQTEADLWRFLVYRADNGGDRQLIKYVNGEDNQFSETLDADGSYVYYLMSQDETGNVSAYSVGKRVDVDTVAPVVTISMPENGQTYSGTGRLTVTAAIYEEGSGYAIDDVDYYLNDTEIPNQSIELGDLENGVHSVRVDVTDRAGNTGSDTILFVVGNENDPEAPQNVTVPQFSASRSVLVRWQAPDASGVSNYLIYRAESGESALLVSTAPSGTLSYQDTVPADGLYSYYVVARYTSETEYASQSVTTVVDTAAPVITIHAPEKTDYTTEDEFIAIDVAVVDPNPASGVANADIKHYLDGVLFTEAEIDLTDLEDGQHLFKVEATDRAGNKSIKSLSFTLNGTGGGGDDDGDGRPVNRAELLSLLQELKGELSPGHHAALSAFARNGNMKAFQHHLMKFGNSRFISEEATKLLLEAIGSDHSVPGKGKGRGRNR